MTAFVHVGGCGARTELPVIDAAPEPDRHGNTRRTFRCDGCRERVTVTFPPHGPALVPAGFRQARDVDYAVPLDGDDR